MLENMVSGFTEADCKLVILGVRSGEPHPSGFSTNRFVRQGPSPWLPDRNDPEEEEPHVSR